ncbi:MAG: hypothetical protein ABI743_00210 [bacterium]
MRSLFACTVGMAGLAVTLAACSGSGAQSPTNAPVAAATSPTFAPAYAFTPGAESMVGAFHVTIDPETLNATATPIVGRNGASQPPQAISYDLDIANFLKPDSFQIVGIQADPDGDLALKFSHKHPFSAVNFSGPISGKNRADLGYTGRLMIIADGTPQNFFSNSVKLDPTLVKNPDGYCNTGDLLTQTGLTNNTFPFVLLADEAEDNRVGISNSGNPMGNYTSASGGWQRGNAGTGGNGWTGFDYVHGGQEVTNTFTLHKEALIATSYALDVAILIKYTDPRGVGGRTMRFPVEPADVSKFAYRLPFSALDNSKITFDPLTIDAAGGSSTTLDMAVRDWNHDATESADADLSDDLDVSTVEPGAPGDSPVDLDVSFLVGTPVPISVSGSGSGLPGFEVLYSSLVTNSLGTATAGDYAGLVRITDPRDALADDGYHFGVDPATIIPSAARALSNVTYQVIPVTVNVSTPVPDITAVVPTTGCSGSSMVFSATNIGGAATSWNWNFGGGAVPNTSTDPMPAVTAGAGGIYSGIVTATNATGSSTPFNFTFRIAGANGWFTNYNIRTGDGTNNRGWTPRTALLNGKPVVISCSITPVAATTTTTNYELSFASSADPITAGDWTTYNVASTPDAAIWGSADIENLNGRLIVTYRYMPTASNPPISGELRCMTATVVEPAVPTITDWLTHTVDPGPNCGRDSSIVVHDGKLAVGYWSQTGGSANGFRVAQANVALPAATADWSVHAPEGTANVGVWTGMISYDVDGDGPDADDRLAGCYWDFTNYDQRFAMANTLHPAAPGDWTIYSVGPNPGTTAGRFSSICSTMIAGQPRLAMSYSEDGGGIYNTTVAISQVTVPTMDSQWARIQLGGGQQAFGPWGTDIIDDGGRILVVWNHNVVDDDLGIARATTNNPLAPGDFVTTYPETGVQTGLFPRFVRLSNGNVAVAYRDQANFTTTTGNLRWIARGCGFP